MSTPVPPANDLLVKRLLQAPRERVYAAWTHPDELLTWFGPETCQATSARLDLRVGGEYHIHIRSEKMGEADLGGVYREVTAPSRLAFTWKWSGNPRLEFNETLVTVDFLAVNDGTDVHILHELLPNAELRDDHTEGWSGCLDKLAKVLGVAEGRAAVPTVGSFCWNELLARDPAAATTFYTRLFKWQTADFPQSNSQYVLFQKQNQRLAGLMPLAIPEVLPQWLAYVAVADVDACVREAVALGAKMVAPPMDIPSVGRIAVIQDPQGAILGLFKGVA